MSSYFMTLFVLTFPRTPLDHFYMPGEARGMSSNRFWSCGGRGSPKLLKFLRFLLVLVDHLVPIGFLRVP